MTKAASISIGLIVLCGTIAIGRAQSTATDAAIRQAVQREADRITLRQKLEAAQAAEARKDLPAAAKLYEEAYKLVLGIGPNIDAEKQTTVAGYTAVQLELARAAQKLGDYHQAKTHLTLVLKVDPLNADGLSLMKENERVLESLKGREPSPATLERVGQIREEMITANTHVQNGKLLLEMGKIDEAEKELKEALKDDPQNQPAFYYLSFVKEARYRQADRLREQHSKDSAVQVEQDWSPPNKAENLPVPNSYATTNLIWTGSGRQKIVSQLNSTKLDSFVSDGLPLSEVVLKLSAETKARDPLKKGLNFIINPNAQAAAAPAGPTAIDPSTGLPVAAPPQEAVDVSSIPVKINPPLTDMRLADVLDIIVKVADRPIKYSIEEWGIMFSLKGAELQPLFMREFKVDPNTFYQGLESVGTLIVGDIQSTSGGGGGGGGSRGGGGGGGGGGQGGQGNGGIGIPRVNVAGGSIQGGGGGGQQGGQQGGGGGGGVRFLTRTNNMEEVHSAVRNFFTLMGIDLNAPKSVFWNDRAGVLLVKATIQDLDDIERIIQVLNIVPHQISIKAKFVEIDQLDSKALGFNWFLGNMIIGDSVIASGGTQPSFRGRSSAANPAGSFPGQYAPGDGLIPPTDTRTPISGTDSALTSGLRNQVGRQGGELGTVAPAIASFTGILTDPQFKVVINALEQRSGADLLNAPEVVTPSGRQAQIQIVDIITIVTGTSLNQTSSGGGNAATTGTTTGGTSVGTTVDYPTAPIPVGTTLDVVPYISADGYTIQLTIIPTITEFVGYDDPGQFIPQGQSVAGNTIGTTITAQLPLPRTRVRQVTTSAVVWDGQTVVLGGLITEYLIRFKDKVPLLGDLPWLGKLFRSESSQNSKRNLVIFVTPTIIDPAGNRLHLDGTMPFDVNTIPPGQKPAVDASKAPGK